MREPIVIYHNPRCSKSRQALALLREHGTEPEIVEYLKAPLDEDGIRRLLGSLGITARELVRRGEAPYRDLGLADAAKTSDELIAAIAANPILMERPVICRGERALIGRPPERVGELLAS